MTEQNTRQKAEPMSDEKWKSYETKWKNWVKDNPNWTEEFEGLMSIPSLIKRGKKKPEKRTRIATAIRTCFVTDEVPDNPFAAGATSSLPDKVEDMRASELKEMRKALIAYWKGCKQAQNFEVKSKRGGGGVFTSAEEFADYRIETSLKQNLGTYYNDYQNNPDSPKADYHWKGTATPLINNIPTLKAAAAAKKASAKEEQ
tara:strand:+ start:111 stop:713 length:603 start_codon:yes stop_codon:yes gene_type:complete